VPSDVDQAGQVVRDYLRALRDPESLRDDRAALEFGWLENGGGDVIDRLKARQQVLDLQDSAKRMRELEQQFVKLAKRWADTHGVSEDAFRAEGVQPSVLQAAGWRRGRGRTAAAARPATPGRSRPRVTATDVWIAIPDGEPFTLQWLVDQTGASTGTVRKVIADELKAGHIADEGPDPKHTGRGRPPTVYRWVAAID
jgi:hypothetical protein